MLCRDPRSFGGQAFGCGQCLPCRFNKRREWTHRIMLEAGLYEENAFISLTYSDEHLPRIASVDVAELRPRDLQLWLKRLRKAVPERKLRFFAVGEYGDESQRPHYHAAVFNFPSCHRGRTEHRRQSCCVVCDLVGETWGLGGVDVGVLEVSSAQYVAGYVTKKLTRRDDPRLNGRHPEFARMSLRPGIGVPAMHEVASQLMTFNLDTSETDVPVSLRHGKRLLPLGRHLRRKLRMMTGGDGVAPKEAQLEYSKKMLPLQEAAKKYSEGSWTDLLVESTKGKAASLESRSRIFKKRGSL